MAIRSGIYSHRISPAESKSNRPFFSRQNNSIAMSPEEKSFFPKLATGQQDDKYEQHADAMANRVVNSTEPPLSGSAIHRKCEECAQEEKLQRMSQEEDEVQKTDVTEEEEEVK